MWRGVLIRSMSEYHGTFREKAEDIRGRLSKVNVKRQLLTICQWLDMDCYRIAPLNPKVEIPIILQHFGSKEECNSSADCAKQAIEFKRINKFMGGEIKKYLKENFGSMPNADLCGSLIEHLSTIKYEGKQLVDPREDNELLCYIRDLVYSMEHLVIVEILENCKVPISKLGKPIQLIED
jgi:hypothetical protein